jgi:hypothetical protein
MSPVAADFASAASALEDELDDDLLELLLDEPPQPPASTPTRASGNATRTI